MVSILAVSSLVATCVVLYNGTSNLICEHMMPQSHFVQPPFLLRAGNSRCSLFNHQSDWIPSHPLGSPRLQRFTPTFLIALHIVLIPIRSVRLNTLPLTSRSAPFPICSASRALRLIHGRFDMSQKSDRLVNMAAPCPSQNHDQT